MLMKWFLYNVLFFFAYMAMLPSFLLRMRKRGGYARCFGERFGRYDPDTASRLSEKPRIWIHAVSVGEANLAGSVISEIRGILPGASFIISTTSSTGRGVCEKIAGDGDVVIYFPLDFPVCVKRALRQIKASAFILTESEFWPNMIRALRRSGVPVMLVNGRISDRSAPRYKAGRFFFKEIFECFSVMLTQSDIDGERLVSAGAPADRIMTMGSVKFDVRPVSVEAESQARASLLKAGIGRGLVLLGGSTWPGEELALALACREANKSGADMRLVVVPRHMERGGDVERELLEHGFKCMRRSRIKAGTESAEPSEDTVLVVDTTGELSALYPAADIVFVGKSLDPNAGGQNMIEPAACGKPVIVGPHTENFLAVMEEFRKKQAICEVADATALSAAVQELVSDARRRRMLGETAKSVVDSQRGALARSAREIVRRLRQERAR